MPKNDSMKERRDALDLAIKVLDAARNDAERLRVKMIKAELSLDFITDNIENINRAIQILTAMKDEGPLL